jgi:hypothetical protein
MTKALSLLEQPTKPRDRDTTSERALLPFLLAQRQFDAAADQMGLDVDVRRILSRPMNELVVHFPVRMDDGHVEMFTGYRVQHKVLGPFKGGFVHSISPQTRSALAADDSACAIARFHSAGERDSIDPATPELAGADLRTLIRPVPRSGRYDIPAWMQTLTE